MRILCSIAVSGKSGASPQSMLICNELKKRGVEVALLNVGPFNVKHTKPYFESEVEGLKILYPIGSIIKTVRAWAPDVFVAYTLHGNVYREIKNIKKICPVVVRLGINLIELMVMGTYQLTLPGVVSLLRSVDHVSCGSMNTVNQILGLDIPREKTSYIPTAIDRSKFKISNCTDPTILTMGRIEAIKNHITTIQTFNLVKQRIPEAELAIAGSGGTFAQILEQIMKEMKLMDYKFTGFVDDLNFLFSEVSVFMLPSISENMPGSVLEAMACGIPCIISDAGWGNTFESVLKAKHDDPLEFADHIVRLIKDRDYWLKIRNAQLEELDQKFRLEETIDLYVELFERLVRK